MKIKYVFLFLLLFLVESIVFADNAIINRNYSEQKKSSITRSNRVKQTIISNQYDNDSLSPAIKEINQQIKKNPNDYKLYATLVDLYLNTKQYEQAFENNIFLYNLKKNNKLQADTVSIIEQIFNSYSKLSLKHNELYSNLAVMALILDNKKSTDYIFAGLEHSKNTDITKKLSELCFESAKNPARAMNLCEKILAKNPYNTEIRKIRASYYIQQNQKKEALEEYQAILDVTPNDESARLEMYKLLSSTNTDEKEMLKRLYAKINPFDYEKACVALTELLLKNNEYSSAKYYADKLIKKYDKNPNGYILMSEIYKMEGKTKEAYEVLSQARDKADDNKTMAKYNVMLAKLTDEPVREANNLIASGLYEQALELLDSANPESLYVILTQARTNYLLNNKQKTFDLLNKAMSLFPNNSDVYCAFGYIYLQEKDTETARNYVDKSLKINKDNNTAKDLLNLINRADSEKYTSNILDALESQNFSEALRLVNEAMAIDSKSPDLYYYKSLVYIALNKYTDASATLYKCIELNRNYIDAYFYLGVVFDNLNESKNALENYKKYLDMTNGNEIGSTDKVQHAKSRIVKLKQ